MTINYVKIFKVTKDIVKNSQFKNIILSNENNININYNSKTHSHIQAAKQQTRNVIKLSMSIVRKNEVMLLFISYYTNHRI